MQNTYQTLLPIVVLTLSVFICITDKRKYDVKASADDYDLTRNDEVYNRVLQVSVLFY